jgi:isoleucyl-tRNA synthetase
MNSLQFTDLTIERKQKELQMMEFEQEKTIREQWKKRTLNEKGKCKRCNGEPSFMINDGPRHAECANCKITLWESTTTK